jgi:Asp/Glu/hydantoin racemase
MRILLLNPNTSASVTSLVADRVAAVAGDAATFVPVTARFGPAYISSRAGLAIAGHGALDAFAEHGAGCDAVFIACFGDPGLLALREIAPVPVVGMLEASCREAQGLGTRYAIVTGGALWKPMLEEIVASLRLEDGLAAIRTIPRTGGEIAKDPDAALPDLAAACRACAEEDRAEAVILGGAAMAGLAARLQPSCPVPILCSVEAGVRGVLAAARAPYAPPPVAGLESTGLGPALDALLRSRDAA